MHVLHATVEVGEGVGQKCLAFEATEVRIALKEIIRE